MEELYELVDKKIEQFFQEFGYDFSIYKVGALVGKLILDLDLRHPVYHDNVYMEVEDSLKLVEEFFASLGKEALDSFYGVLSLGKIRFNNSLLKSYVDKEGNINISLTNSIDDAFLISHEFMHRLFYQKVGESKTFDNINFLMEIVSMTIEMMLADYLIEKNVNKDIAYQHKYNIIKLLEPRIYEYLVQLIFLEVYQNKGYVSREIVIKYIYKSDYRDKEKLVSMIDQVAARLASDEVYIWYYLRYIIGVFASFYLKSEFREDIKKAFKLGTHIYQDNLSESLKDSDIDFLRDTNIFKRIFMGKREIDKDKLYVMNEVMVKDFNEIKGYLENREVKK